MIKLPEPEITMKWNGSSMRWEEASLEDCMKREEDDRRVGYTESQLKQSIRDALEEAAQKIILEANNARADGRFIHEDATLRCAHIVGRMKEQS